MSKNELLQKILIGNSDKTIQFSGLCRLLLEMGFKRKNKGKPSHIHKRKHTGNHKHSTKRFNGKTISS